MFRRFSFSIVYLLASFMLKPPHLAAQAGAEPSLRIIPGDTWTALAYRFNTSTIDVMQAAGAINPQRQPVIGSSFLLHEFSSQNGVMDRPFAGGALETSARHLRSPWMVSIQNDRAHPYSPLLFTPVFLKGGVSFPRELPSGFESLAVSSYIARPGEALAIKARIRTEVGAEIDLDSNPWLVFRNNDRLVGLGATSAFYGNGTPEICIQVDKYPLWAQPWLFIDKNWNYDQVVFKKGIETSREAIEEEKTRLQEIWENTAPEPLWSGSFTLPLKEFVDITSHYGARRSVNGGPYDTYHEGTDFSAYRGTAVYAPAAGQVVLAEPLKVRGSAVLVDHGLGIHSGYYHLSKIDVKSGDWIKSGEKLGEVGSTGRSTGNHLHWDLLIGLTWVDPEAWMNSQLAEWIYWGWNIEFPKLDDSDMPS